MSGCAKKRDSSLTPTTFGDSPKQRKLISNLGMGVLSLPPTTAHSKNNRPVNMRPATGRRIQGDGGEKKESPHRDHFGPPTTFITPLLLTGGLLAFFPQHRLAFLKYKNRRQND